MRIGIDIRTLMDARYSGVPLHNYNLVKGLLALDRQNEYLLYYNSFGKNLELPEFDRPNVKIIRGRYPNKLLNYLNFKILNRPKIDKRLEADIFLMPHANFIALSGKAKSVLTIHDLSFMRFKEFFSIRKNIWHRMINVRKLIKKFDHIVAVSESTKNDIIDLCGVDEKKVRVIYPGLGPEFRPLKENNSGLASVKRKYALPDKFILYLGTLEPRKNVEGIIAGYDGLRRAGEIGGFKLVIAGGKGWKTEKIFSAYEKSRFKNDIAFIGYVKEEEKVFLYNLASLFVFPSFYEGAGLPPLEAMASGAPVLTSFTSSLPEIAGGASLMADPYNINDIRDGMKAVLCDSELRRNMVSRGLELAKKFSWEKCASEYLSVISGL